MFVCGLWDQTGAGPYIDWLLGGVEMVYPWWFDFVLHIVLEEGEEWKFGCWSGSHEFAAPLQFE